MNSAKEYGFEDDYEGYEDLESGPDASGQPKTQIKYKEFKKKREAW